MNTPPTVCHQGGSRPIWQSIYLIVPAVMLLGFLCTGLYLRLATPTLRAVGPASPREILTLTSAWAKGETIVLVRHMERCDRSATPCLDGLDGITVRGKNLAAKMGEAFERLGVQNADIFTSPTTRTKQTAMNMFKPAAVAQEWLVDCKTITLGDIARYKKEGRNLVLVTHSHCIEQIERNFEVSAVREPAYGALSFITLDERNKTPVARGMVEAEQFITHFSTAK